MSEERIDPLHNNIRAARAIVNTVRTTLDVSVDARAMRKQVA